MSQQQIFSGGNAPVAPDIEFIQGTSGGPVGPNPATFTINFTSDDLAIDGNPGTFTLNFVDLVKWTPYVVDDVNPAPYTTIQSAIDAVSTYQNVIDFDIDFVALNSIVATVDAVALPPVIFVIDQATTIALLAAMISTATGVASATVTGPRQITVIFDPGSFHVVNSVITTLGVSQPTATITSSSTAPENLILVRYGSGNYVENLIIPSGITIMGVFDGANTSSPVLITGSHSIPSSGNVEFINLRMNDATAVVSNSAANSTALAWRNCSIGVTNGFTADVTASTGVISFKGCIFSGIDDGLVNNATGTAVIIVEDSTIGGGGQVLTSGGNIVVKNSTISCRSSLVNNCAVTSNDSYLAAIAFNNASTGAFVGGKISGAAVAAITQSSTGAISLVNVAIDSNNNPSIAGAGAGIITMACVPFLDNIAIAGTLTTAAYDWKPYATQGTSVTATVGTASFNEDDFSVVNGFVSGLPITVSSNYTDVTTAMSPYVVTATDYFISVDSTAGPVIIQLPNTTVSYREFVIKDRTGQADTNNITVTTVGGAVTIDGTTSWVFTDNYESLEMLFNGTSYETF